MPDEFFVDSSRCLTAFVSEAPKTRGDLFALEPFDSISEIIFAAEDCYPLKCHVESMHGEIWTSLATIVTDICDQDISTEEELAGLENFGEPSDFEKLVDLVMLEGPIVSAFNNWLEAVPQGEDWEHGDVSVDGYRAAFEFFEEEPEISDTLGIEIIEGRHPGDNTQVAELAVSTDEANKRAKDAGLDIVFKDIT